MYFVYVLMCNDRKRYIGYTANLNNRVKQHVNGEVFATKGRLPVNLIFYEAFKHRMDAKRREKYFKTTAGKKALSLMLRRFYQEK
ncbi:MAG: GIY-YIG nuclease family protein [Patescibacteria group bacterium]